MTIPFLKGRYQLRFAASEEDVAACQRLRHLSFFGVPGVDADRFDAACRHVMVHDQLGGLVATMRLYEGPAEAGYTAQFYDLSRLVAQHVPMLEVGRFCIAPGVQDTDVLRAVWGALTAYVDAQGVAILFGCASFAGTDPGVYGRALPRLLRHCGPDELRPVATRDAIPLGDCASDGAAPLPPLLRTYLAMGGWVGDALVVDPTMQTMHVFTCLEVGNVPAARARALRALAQEAALT